VPDTELSRALQDLTPEPPRTLYGEELVQLARRRRTRRIAALSSAPVAVAVVVAVALHGSGPSPSVAVSEPTPTATEVTPVPAPSEPPVTDMHAVDAPAGPLTGGSADVDGDGRADRVTVSSATGGVTVELNGGPTLHANLPNPDGSYRLQAIADLWGTGTREILIYSSAAGCCGYQPVDSTSWVLAVVGQQLRVVRDGQGRPLQLGFSNGRGGNYSGIECRSSSHQVIQTGINTADHTRRQTTITLSGATATVSAPTTTSDQRAYPQDFEGFKVAVGCDGLTSNGSAAT
jgi:hypothetical protein